MASCLSRSILVQNPAHPHWIDQLPGGEEGYCFAERLLDQLRYLIFPWGNSMGCFHDVFKARSDQWEEFSYEDADVDKPRTWDAHFVWKIRRQGLSGYKHTEGPPPKSFGRGEGEQLQVLNYMPHFKDIMSKTGLVNVAKKYAQVRKVEWPNFLPISYCLSPFWVQEMNEEGLHPLKSIQIEDFIFYNQQHKDLAIL